MLFPSLRHPVIESMNQEILEVIPSVRQAVSQWTIEPVEEEAAIRSVNESTC
jgi:hypothetical protein